ncbi:MAG: hypothetical protein AAB567_02630 [Patescibacteria group bacterium]
MDILLQADIFFFVSTIAVIAIAIFLVAMCMYVLKILGDIRYIIGRLRKEGDFIIEDIEGLREFLKKEGKKVTPLGQFISLIVSKIFAKRERSSRR